MQVDSTIGGVLVALLQRGRILESLVNRGVESVVLSAFDDKSKEPQAAALRMTLGRSSAHWESLIAYLEAEFAPLDQTWNFSGAKWGWSLRLKQKKRTILYLTPCHKHFVVGFAFGEKAVKAAHDYPLSDSILAAIDGAPKYAEGRGVRVEVRTKRDLVDVKQMSAVKMAN